MEIEAGAELPLEGDLRVPEASGGAKGLVIFVHGSGSSRFSPRNRQVAEALNHAGLATLLFDLLTPAEEPDRSRVFDIELLAERLEAVTGWVRSEPEVGDLPLGYFGASTGAAAALHAAGSGADVRAVVSRGGRPDLAGDRLERVHVPALLIVGGADEEVLRLNEGAAERLDHSELAVVPGATHLFEEAGALERVSELAADWFTRHLGNETG